MSVIVGNGRRHQCRKMGGWSREGMVAGGSEEIYGPGTVSIQKT